MKDGANPRFRVLYALWAFLECTGFGGLIYGWGSLVYVLKEEGIYSDLCASQRESATRNYSNISMSLQSDGSSDKVSCPEQESRLSLVFTIGSSMLGVGCFFIGQINFRYGTRFARIIASLIYMGGAFLIAFTSKETPWLIFPGMSAIGFGGIAYQLTNFQIANLFPVMGSAVIGLLCGGFDSSAGIQLMVKIGYENGMTRQKSYLIIACTHVLTFVSTFWFLPQGFINKLPAGKSVRTIDVFVASNEISRERSPVGRVNDVIQDGSFHNIFKHVFSMPYLLHVFWMSVLQLRFYYFMGSVNKSFETLVNKDKVSHYTNVFLYIMMGGLVVSPCVGFFFGLNFKLFKKSRSTLRRHMMPTVIPLAISTTLCVIMSGLVILEDHFVLYPIFVIFLLFRSFMYTMAAGYLRSIFQSAYVPSLYGLLIFTGGLVGLLQYPLYRWSDSASDGHKQVNIFLLTMSSLTYIHPGYQWWAARRAEAKMTHGGSAPVGATSSSRPTENFQSSRL